MTNWMPGAKLIISPRDGGSMLGGSHKVVWHTTENDPRSTTATNVAKYLLSSGNEVHLVWNPNSGEIVQMIPANRAGRGLENHAGGVETNRAGTVVIQIEVVGRASSQFTAGPCVGLAKVQAWLTSLGVPAVWAGTEDRSTSNWSKSGHFGHMDVPENSHTDPGRVDKAKLAHSVLAPVVIKPVVKPVVKPPAPVVRNIAQVKVIQSAIHVVPDGHFGPASAKSITAIVHRNLADVRYLQSCVGTKVDGVWGPSSEAYRILAIKRVQIALGITGDGAWGPNTARAWLAFYNANYNR